MKLLTTFVLLALSLRLSAQISIDRPIELTGAQPEDRQVLGLPPASQPAEALDAATLQSGAAHWVGTTTLAPWDIAHPSLADAPAPGTALSLRIGAEQTGSAALVINGFGPYAVLRSPGAPLLLDGLPVGSVLTLVFDGTAFQVTNGAEHAKRPCPNGLVAVNGSYCIEPGERIGIGFFEAALACAQSGLRLCSWAEFSHACQRRVELGLTGMTNEWEWTNDASNEDQSVRVVGSGSCQVAGNRLTSSTLATDARCCFTR